MCSTGLGVPVVSANPGPFGQEEMHAFPENLECDVISGGDMANDRV